LNGAGVDPDAVQSLALRVTTIGQRREAFVELDRRRDGLLRGMGNDALDAVVLGAAQDAIDGAAGGPETAALRGLIGGVKALFSEASKSQSEQESIHKQAEKLNPAVTELSRSVV
jgi:hypothetical protein